MSKEKNGGSAFPCDSDAAYWERSGMSLRDCFAAKALQSSFGNPICITHEEKDYLARHCYFMTDTMLKERER